MDLRSPKIKRRTFFLEVQKSLKAKGKKLQNMKTQFNKILDNNNKKSTGRGRMPWPYFDQMAEIYSNEAKLKKCVTCDTSAPMNRNEEQACSSSSISLPRFSEGDMENTPAKTEDQPPKPRASKVDITRSQILKAEAEKIELAKAHLAAIHKLIEIKQKETELLEVKLKQDAELMSIKERELELAAKRMKFDESRDQ